MSQNCMCDVKIPEGELIRFEQESSFENFIGQFQIFCPEVLLCVVDGTCLRYYDKHGTLPANIRFDYKQRRGKITEYYFRDIGNDSLFCVFGREAAKIFYPRIDEVDPVDGRNQTTIHLSDSNNNKENSIIKSIKDPLSYLPKESTIPKNNLSYINPIANQITKSRLSPEQSECKRPIIIQTIKKDRTTGTNMQSHVSNAIKSVSLTPKQVTIIDRGVRFKFPNTNYPIEILTHYPN